MQDFRYLGFRGTGSVEKRCRDVCEQDGNGWRKVSDVMCDKRVSAIWKGPVMMYE